MADRGYFSGEEILACEQAGITITLPKPMTSGAKSDGRFGKQNFVYLLGEDVYRCPAGERLEYRFTNLENGMTRGRDWFGYLERARIDACSSTNGRKKSLRAEIARYGEMLRHGTTRSCGKRWRNESGSRPRS